MSARGLGINEVRHGAQDRSNFRCLPCLNVQCVAIRLHVGSFKAGLVFEIQHVELGPEAFERSSRHNRQQPPRRIKKDFCGYREQVALYSGANWVSPLQKPTASTSSYRSSASSTRRRMKSRP